MEIPPRRSTLKTLGTGLLLPVVAASVSTVLAQQTPQSPAPVPLAFANDHVPRPLAFDPSQLDGLSEKIINSHWQNNYGGSVSALNAIKQRLESALADDDLPAYVYNDLKREHLMRTGSVVLHELYFDNLAPPGGRNAELDQALAAAFGNVATWEKEFRRIASGLGGGSGWVMLAWNTHTASLENFWMADHMHTPPASLPVLVLDMYEHSYHMDYGAAAGQYIEAFMRNINWEELARRLDVARMG